MTSKPDVVGRLVSVNVGQPREVEWEGQTITTAIWKHPVGESVMVRRVNIDGDAQADLAAHGGEHRAVFVYQLGSYAYWEKELERDDLIPGQFGENFTVDGLADDEVCIGDRYRIGEAVFEVTQPRVTCFRVAIRMNEPRMPSLLVAHHRPGFYFRVLTEGRVAAGDPIERLAVGPEQVSVAEIDALLYLPRKSTRTLERALRIPALSDGWKASFRAMAAKPAAEPPAAWPGFIPLRVTAIQKESAQITSFTLTPDGEHRLRAHSVPGQYLTVRLQVNGDNGPPVIRSYSMSTVAGAAGYRISVRRIAGGAGSCFLHERLRVGDTIDAAAPRGGFILSDGDRPVVLISAGVGATPVLAMLHSLAGARDPREIWWVHGARDQAAHAFAEEVGRLLSDLPNAHRLVSFSRPDPGQKPGTAFDAVGRIDAATLNRAKIPFDADHYLCGPDAFMRTLSAAIAARGTPSEQIHAELFGTGAVVTPPGMNRGPTPHQPNGPAGPGPGPTVTFSRSNLTVSWDPEFHNLLEMAEACEVPVSFGCRNGVCHYCESGLLTGNVDYVTEPLETPDADRVLVCCAAPESDITLEL